MRPGEVVPGGGPTPRAAAERAAQLTVHNAGRFAAYIGSHFDLARASASLEFDRSAAEGARVDLPAGATARVAAGETTELRVIWD